MQAQQQIQQQIQNLKLKINLDDPKVKKFTNDLLDILRKKKDPAQKIPLPNTSDIRENWHKYYAIQQILHILAVNYYENPTDTKQIIANKFDNMLDKKCQLLNKADNLKLSLELFGKTKFVKKLCKGINPSANQYYNLEITYYLNTGYPLMALYDVGEYQMREKLVLFFERKNNKEVIYCVGEPIYKHSKPCQSLQTQIGNSNNKKRTIKDMSGLENKLVKEIEPKKRRLR